MNEHCSQSKPRSALRILAWSAVLCASLPAVRAQGYIEACITEGLQANKRILAQEFALEQSLYALREAQSLFYPSVSLRGDYFLADGGRTIDIPVGNIVNPIYARLNEIGNGPAFPQIENASELLNPNNFYDLRLRASMPLLNREIEYIRRIRQHQVSLQEIERDLYKRELVLEIKSAYYNYLKAAESVDIFNEAVQLARENLRTNKALFAAEKVNRTAVTRSESEVNHFEALHTAAQQTEKTARSYFNFLLGREQSTPIERQPVGALPPMPPFNTESTSAREELQKLRAADAINSELIGLSKSYIVPKLNTFVDVGSQAFDWKWDNRTLYYFFGVSLQWDIFSAGRNNYRIKQAKLSRQENNAQTDYVENELALQLTSAENEYHSAMAHYEAALSRRESSSQYYRDTELLYREGQAIYIELLDAQNQWVSAKLQANISLYELWICAAKIERATATIHLH